MSLPAYGGTLVDRTADEARAAQLRTEAEEGNAPYYADAVAKIFRLLEDDE